jgi:hypothetical protein
MHQNQRPVPQPDYNNRSEQLYIRSHGLAQIPDPRDIDIIPIQTYIAGAFAAHDEQQTVCAAPVMIVDDIVFPVGGAVSCQVCAKMVSAGE